MIPCYAQSIQKFRGILSFWLFKQHFKRFCVFWRCWCHLPREMQRVSVVCAKRNNGMQIWSKTSVTDIHRVLDLFINYIYLYIYIHQYYLYLDFGFTCKYGWLNELGSCRLGWLNELGSCRLGWLNELGSWITQQLIQAYHQ